MPKAETKKNKRVFLFGRIAVVVSGIIWGAFWISKQQLWGKLAGVFGQMDMLVFAGVLGIFVIGQIIVGFRWWLLLRAQSISIPLWPTVRLYFLGWFYNNFMPSSVGGDLVRAWYVTKHTDKKFEAVLSVFVDRVVVGLLSTLIIAVFFYLLFLRGKGCLIASGSQGGLLTSVVRYKQILLWVVGVLAAAFATALLHRKGRAILQKAWAFIRARSLSWIAKFTDAIAIYCSKPLTILAAFGLTIFMQIMVITSFWFLGRSLGIEASIKYYYVFFTLMWVLAAVPVSIGGAVVMEGGLAYLFVKFAGVDADAAIAIALCQRLVWMLASLPGAAIHLIGAHLPQEPNGDKMPLPTPKDPV